MKDIVILGAGGFAREVCGIFEDLNQDQRDWNVLGFIDEDPKLHGREMCGLPVLGAFGWFDRPRPPMVICGVGGNRLRRKFSTQAERLGLRFASAIHPAARVSRHVTTGLGAVICAGCDLTTQICVGHHVNLNLHCTVGHDAVIESFCNLSPGVHISGHAQLEADLDIGTGAVVLPAVRIGHDSIIGAGAVVNRDIPPGSLAVGVPARVVRSLLPPAAESA
jgi:sugar O-acyltransferase (sialic acid O-acetyltransferase NeuD family)